MNTSNAEDYGLKEPPHKKPIVLAPPPVEKKPSYELRRQCWRCRDLNPTTGKPALHTFDKLLFDRLTDMAYEPQFRRGDGIIECSKKYLADDYGCSVSTLTRATRRLETTGFIWTQTRWDGAVEMTWWFIRDQADDSKEYPAHTGENYGRRRRGVQRNTVRSDRGKFVANPDSIRSRMRRLLATHGLTDEAVKAGLLPDHGQACALSGGTAAPEQGAKVHPVHGQKCSLPGSTVAPGQGAQPLPDKEQSRSRTGSTAAPGQGAGVTGLKALKTIKGDSEGVSTKRSTVVNAQRWGGGPRKASRENTFLLDVAAAMDRWKKGHSKIELSGSGAWWRLAFRADVGLIEKVLADTLSAIKEGRIKKSPGQHAVDLWQRWGGPCVAQEDKP